MRLLPDAKLKPNKDSMVVFKRYRCSLKVVPKINIDETGPKSRATSSPRSFFLIDLIVRGPHFSTTDVIIFYICLAEGRGGMTRFHQRCVPSPTFANLFKDWPWQTQLSTSMQAVYAKGRHVRQIVNTKAVAPYFNSFMEPSFQVPQECGDSFKTN